MKRQADAALAALFQRDRALALAGLGALTLLAWRYTIPAGDHTMASGSVERLLVLIGMWTVMMIAMMAPVAAPVVLTFARLSRGRRPERDPVFHTGALAAGFLLAWTTYSVAGALAHWALERAAWAPQTTATSTWGGALFLLAGVYQWTPVKHACLRKCRSPLGVLMTGWRPGLGGALRLGAGQGAHCVACCWALMALMLLAGAMNPLWLAALAVFCLIERLLPAGHLVARIAGVGLVGWGVYAIAL